MDGTKPSHRGDGRQVDRQQEQGRKGPDGGLGPKLRYLGSAYPTMAAAKREKKKNTDVRILQKNRQQAAGFGGPAAAKSLHRRERMTLCTRDAYIKLGESTKISPKILHLGADSRVAKKKNSGAPSLDASPDLTHAKKTRLPVAISSLQTKKGYPPHIHTHTPHPRTPPPTNQPTPELQRQGGEMQHSPLATLG